MNVTAHSCACARACVRRRPARLCACVPACRPARPSARLPARRPAGLPARLPAYVRARAPAFGSGLAGVRTRGHPRRGPATPPPPRRLLIRETGGVHRNPAPRNHFLVWIVKPSGCHCADAVGVEKTCRRAPTPLRGTFPLSELRLRREGLGAAAGATKDTAPVAPAAARVTAITFRRHQTLRLPRTCPFRARRGRRGNSKCPAKSSPCTGRSAGTEVACVYGSGTVGAFWILCCFVRSVLYVLHDFDMGMLTH